ncbi:hypothetical protein [Candidatus Lokiarchaeum ossiferum]|uniref:hypothetical protein n=1 Tax=Candidatus Lokiarchaeum ossiferum TaxID=2951803 RepID=UPI00352C5223
MNIDFSIFIPNFAGFVLITLIIFFTIQKSNIHRSPIKYFLLNMIFGWLYAVVVIIYSFNLFDSESVQKIFQISYLMLISMQTIAYFLFLESIMRKIVSRIRFAIVFVSFSIQILGQWIVFGFMINNLVHLPLFRMISLFGKLGYDVIQIFVYGFCGIPTYQKMYTYTKERKAKLLLYAQYILLIGAIIPSVIGIYKIYHSLNPVLVTIKIIGDSLPIVGIFLFFFVNLSDLSFLYQVPYDHYFLIVSIKNNGLVVLNMKFENKRTNVKIGENLISGMVSALNAVYKSIFNSTSNFSEIVSDDISMVFETGQYVNAMIGADQISGIVKSGLKQFVLDFENHYADILSTHPNYVGEFQDGKQMVKKIFPFLIEQKK